MTKIPVGISSSTLASSLSLFSSRLPPLRLPSPPLLSRAAAGEHVTGGTAQTSSSPLLSSPPRFLPAPAPRPPSRFYSNRIEGKLILPSLSLFLPYEQMWEIHQDMDLDWFFF